MTALAFRDRPGAASAPQVLALVTDSATEAMARLAAAELGLGEIAVEGADLEAAATRLHNRASPSVLIVDLDGARSGEDSPLTGLNHLAEACDPGVKVIAVGMHNDVALYRTLIQSGIADYLVKPVTAHDLVRAIRDGVSFGPKAAVVELVPHSETGSKAKRFVPVVGTRGGIGASTVAANLAVALSQREAHPSALLDLDFRFGNTAVTFDIEPGSGFKDVLADPTRIDPLLVERAATKVSDKLVLLAGEESLATTPPSTAGLVPLIEALSRSGGWVVADVPRDLLVREPGCLDAAAFVVLVTDFSLTSLRDVLRFKEWIAETAPMTKFLLVANGSRPKLEGDLPAEEFSRAAGMTLTGTIPFDAKGVGAAAAASKPVVLAAPRSVAGRAITTISAAIAKDTGDANVKPKGGFTLANLLPFLAKDGGSKA